MIDGRVDIRFFIEVIRGFEVNQTLLKKMLKCSHFLTEVIYASQAQLATPLKNYASDQIREAVKSLLFCLCAQ